MGVSSGKKVKFLSSSFSKIVSVHERKIDLAGSPISSKRSIGPSSVNSCGEVKIKFHILNKNKVEPEITYINHDPQLYKTTLFSLWTLKKIDRN